MKTIALQIGNSDDKLTQREWSTFAVQVDRLIKDTARVVHFHGAPSTFAPWQNAAWIFEIDDDEAHRLRRDLIRLRESYNQDSIAWSECQTTLI